jgi:hypothetical protein
MTRRYGARRCEIRPDTITDIFGHCKICGILHNRESFALQGASHATARQSKMTNHCSQNFNSSSTIPTICITASIFGGSYLWQNEVNCSCHRFQQTRARIRSLESGADNWDIYRCYVSGRHACFRDILQRPFRPCDIQPIPLGLTILKKFETSELFEPSCNVFGGHQIKCQGRASPAIQGREDC